MVLGGACELVLNLQKREIGYCGRYSECGGSSVRLMCRLGGKGRRCRGLASYRDWGCEASGRSWHCCGGSPDVGGIGGGWKDKSRNNPIHLSKDVFFNWTEKNG